MMSFKSTLAMLSLAMTAAVAAPAAPAQAETITCPHSQIRREVTTALPGGWWNTPIVNSLTEARVTNIGGRAALQCIYGPAGSIQRYAPDGATCRVSGRQFECNSGSASGSGARTFSTGPLDIPQTSTADLDRGAVGRGSGVDIWFQAETAELLYWRRAMVRSLAWATGATGALTAAGARGSARTGCRCGISPWGPTSAPKPMRDGSASFA